MTTRADSALANYVKLVALYPSSQYAGEVKSRLTAPDTSAVRVAQTPTDTTAAVQKNLPVDESRQPAGVETMLSGRASRSKRPGTTQSQAGRKEGRE